MDTKKIAETCKISTSAVYKALHHKKGVDAETRERVFRAFSGDLPRAKKKNGMSIGIVLPTTPSYYWDALCQGIKEALPSTTDAHFAFFASLGSGYEGTYALDYLQEMDVLIIAPSHAPSVQAKIAAIAAEKPVIFVSEALDTPQLATVCGDYYDDGLRLGNALSMYEPTRKRVLALHVHNGLGAQTRTNGFLQAIRTEGMTLVGNIALENISAPLASVIARAIRAEGLGNFDCLYCGTGVTPYACLALCKLQLQNDVICIGYENPPGNAPYVKSGLIRLLAVSNAYEMGRQAALIANRYLSSGALPPSHILHIPSQIFVNK